MARLARVVIPDIPHHVTQRGNRGQTVFFGDQDYRDYLGLLGEHTRAAGVGVWAWCLMPNHVHLILVPSHADGLRAALGEVHRRYSRMVNMRNDWRGYLWQGRFASCPMDEAHTLAAIRYVELNPVRAGLVKRPEDWRYSSAGAHLSGTGDGVTDMAALSGLVDDWRAFLAQTPDEITLKAIHSGERTGRPLGDDAFVKQLEGRSGRDLMRRKPGPKPGPKPVGPERELSKASPE